MTEKDKYYTPPIEEFYVGFEYERDVKGDYKFSKKTITKINFTKTIKDFREDVEFMEDDEEDIGFRVKHLDKEDIESLDFEAYKGMEDHPKYHQSFKKGNYAIKHNMVANTIRIVCLNLGFFTESEDCRFSGILKNKSELISQLKRCQIEI